MIGSLLRVRYELLQELGESPVFQTFVAHDRVSERNVVVRTLQEQYSSDSEFVTKLRAVVEKSKRIDHPSVSKPLDFDEDNGSWFVVYQYSPGHSLHERIKRASAFSVSSAISTMINVLEGLDAIHREGLIHGDVSSRNVVVSPGGAAMLLMSGVWESYSASHKAGVEMLPLMAPYIAPEITAGKPLSFTSDVYAAGVLLYETLTSERPFLGKNPVDIATAHATQVIPKIGDKVQAVPDALEKILEKALSKNPNERYAAAGQMLSDLRMLKDAMRFGKPLKWPLNSKDQSNEQRVGPRLNVVRGEEKEQRVANRRAKDHSDGAPAWLVYLGILAMIGAIGAVGWWAYFNINAPKTLLVPNVVGMSFNTAESQLEEMNLKLRISKEESNEEYAEGVIISIRPTVGRDIKEGTYVDAVVSSGSVFVEVPDLRGKTLETGRRVLNSLDLVLSSRVEYVRDPSTPKGTILSQDPAMHIQVRRESQVTVSVSNGNERIETTRPPDETNLFHLEWIFEEEMSAQIKVEMKDNRRTRVIHDEIHDSGERISINADGFGQQATFTIYYDGVIVRTVTQDAMIEEETNDAESEDGEIFDIDDERRRILEELNDRNSGDGR